MSDNEVKSRDIPEIILPSDEDEDTVLAYQYLVLSKAEEWTMEVIADYFGITRNGLWRARKRWTKNGAMEKAAKLLLEPLMEEIETTNRMALKERRGLIERSIEIAKGKYGASARTQLEAIAWLEETIYKPMSELKEESGAPELLYARKAEVLMPTSIPRPKFLKKSSG